MIILVWELTGEMILCYWWKAEIYRILGDCRKLTYSVKPLFGQNEHVFTQSIDLSRVAHTCMIHILLDSFEFFVLLHISLTYCWDQPSIHFLFSSSSRTKLVPEWPLLPRDFCSTKISLTDISDHKSIPFPFLVTLNIFSSCLRNRMFEWEQQIQVDLKTR